MTEDELGEAQWVRTVAVTERPLSEMRSHWKVLSRGPAGFNTIFQSITQLGRSSEIS